MIDAILRIIGRDDTKGAFDSVRRNLGGVKQELAGVRDQIQGVHGHLGTVAAAITTAFAGASLKGAIDLADQVDDLSEKSGIAVEALSGLRYAGEVVGTGFDVLNTGTRKLTQTMSEAAAGGKAQQAAFRTLGVQYRELDGSLRGVDKVILDLSDKFVRFREGPEKAALAAQFFGDKMGREMIPLLNQGAAGITRLADEGARMGAVFGGDLARRSAEFNDNLKKVSESATGVKLALADGMLPELNKLLRTAVLLSQVKGGLLDYLFSGASAADVEAPAAKIGELEGRLANLLKLRRELSAAAKQQGPLAELPLFGAAGDARAVGAQIDTVRGQLATFRALDANNRSRLTSIGDELERQFNESASPNLRGAAPIVGKDTNASGRALDADLERIKARDRVVQALAKTTADTIESEVKRGVRSQLDGVEQLAAVQIAALGSTRAALLEQLAVAQRKDNGEKESAALRGQIAEVDARLAARGVQYENEYLEALAKRKNAIADVLDAQREAENNERSAAEVAAANRYTALWQSITDYGVAIADANEQLAHEVGLVGQTERARALANEQRRIELGLRDKLREIDRADVPEEQKQQERERARAAAARAIATAETRATLDVWERTTQQINESLTDALLRGFEDGKGFAENLRDTLKNMFATMVLRPVIAATLAPVSGALAQTVGGVRGGGGMGGLLNTASNAASLYNGISGYSTGVNSFAGLVGAGSTAGASALSLGYGNAVGAIGGDALGAFIAANGSWGGVAAGGTAAAAGGAAAGGAAAGGVLSTLAAAAPYIAIAAAVISMFSKKGGGPKIEGRAGDTIMGDGLADRAESRQLNTTLATTVKGIQTQYDSLVKQFGGKGGVAFGLSVSTDPAGDSPTFLDIGAKRDGNYLFSNLNRNVGRSEEDLATAIITATVDAQIGALKASDLAKPYADFFNQIAADASTEAKQAAIQAAQVVQAFSSQFGQYTGVFARLEASSVDARAALVKAAGGIDALSNAASGYVQNFYTEEERRTALWRGLVAEAQKLNVVLPSSAKGFRDLIDGLDPNKDQDLIASLLGLANAFATLYGTADDAQANIKGQISYADGLRMQVWGEYDREVDRLIDAAQRQAEGFRTVADSLNEYRRDLNTSSISPITASAQRQLARSVLDDLAAKATGGDAKAAAQLQGAAQSYLELTRNSSASRMEYATEYWYVQRLLATTEDALDQQADASESTIDQLKLQRTDLARLIGVELDSQRTLGEMVELLKSMGRMGTLTPGAGSGGFNPVVTGLYEELFGRAPDADGGAFWSGVFAAGKSVDFVRAEMMKSEEWLRSQGLAQFAEGGYHYGGVRLVGERGPELELTGPARYFSYDQTRRLLDGGGGMSGNDPRWADMEQRLATQEAFLYSIAKNTNQAADGAAMLDRWERLGMPATRVA